MKLQKVTWLVAVVAVTSAQTYLGAGTEQGRISARLQSQNVNNGFRDQAAQNRDSNHFAGNADQSARWAGQNAVKENGLAQNQQTLQQRAQLSNQHFGHFGTNFDNIAKQIRDEALRNQHVVKDDALYKKNNVNGAKGADAAKASKKAFDKGDVLNDNVNYVFNKKYDKASSENGGYEEENGKNHHKLDLIDEREKDRKLLRGDSAVSRSQADQAKAAKDAAWSASAAQQQAQQGKYGFADRRVDQAGERSDDRAVDYDRKDSHYLEQENGRDEAVRLAKDLAEKVAGYNNHAQAAANANRNAADKKFYGGNHIGAGPELAGHTAYGPESAAQAVLDVPGDTAKLEGSGGAIKSGFDETAAQQEKSNELNAAKALSSAKAVNDYERNKDKLAYDQVSGLQDRTQGQFKQGLQDAASQGFSGNNAEAAKSAAESNRKVAAQASSSDLTAKEKNEDEALRDRNYFRKIQNDDDETYTRRKQFFHNKKEGGNNDENLKYDRQKLARDYGLANEADLSKQNQFHNLHQDGKSASQSRNLEDLVDRRANVQRANDIKQAAAKGFDNRQAEEKAKAQAAASGFNEALAKASQDDSQSTAFNRQQSLQDQSELDRNAVQDNKQNQRHVAADVEFVRPTNGNPLGSISSRALIGNDLLTFGTQTKDQKGHTLPDVAVDIQPIPPPPKVQKYYQQQQPIPPLPDVQPVKSYHPPPYSKTEVNYDSGAATNLGGGAFNHPGFSRISGLSLFKGPRQSSFTSAEQPSSHSRFTFHNKAPASASFGRNLLSGTGKFNGYVRGSW